MNILVFTRMLVCAAGLMFCNYSIARLPLFKLLAPTSTGITFQNTITENDRLNILNEAYIYNGGGVGIGDFNNDGLDDIYFAGNMVSNRLYRNKGALKFDDITLKAGVGGEGKWCTGVSVIDINNDGWLDIYVSATFLKDPQKRRNLLYVNQGLNSAGYPVFKDLAASYGIADDGYSTQGVFFDYDRDGDLDLYVLTNTLDDPKTPIQFRPKVVDGSALNTDRLYRNNGNQTFTNVSRAAGIIIEGWGHSVSVSDINKDGWPDLYVSNDFNANDILYINNKDGTFTDRISTYFKHTSWYTMGTDIADINNDGLVDLVALDMLPESNLRKKGMLVGNEYYNYFNSKKFGYQHQYIRNVLQLNRGNSPAGIPVFSEIGYLAGIYETDWSWDPLLADFDNDGFRDLVITNGLPRDVTDLDYIAFDNGQGGGKINTSLKMVGVLPVVKIHNYAFKNKGGYQFANTTTDWGLSKPSFSNGGAYADLDNDGDLDLIINNINEPAFLYENTLASSAELHNQISVELKGPKNNIGAIGARTTVYYGLQQQYYEHQPCRGYLSTVSPKLHFGLANTGMIDSLVITWPDGSSQVVTNLKAGQKLKLEYENAAGAKLLNRSTAVTLLQEVGKQKGIRFKHEEKDAVDYNIQPTIPHKLSQYGPGIAVADIDQNGFDDFYIAGSAGQQGTFYLQDPNGQFTPDTNRVMRIDHIPTEEMGVLFFDADNDGDADLYVVAGSYEFAPNHPGNQDRLYINDKGHFLWEPDRLPVELANGSCVRAADFDGDGDLDLFVGGRSSSGSYPISPESYLLQNNNGRFADVTDDFYPALKKIGMVSDALWSDFDNDGKVDLVIAGEWMPVTFLKNQGKSFLAVTQTPGFSDHVGWWNSLVAADFDSDGDMDYVAGNLGLNSGYKATFDEPMNLYAKDLNNNGRVVPMIFCFMQAEDSTRKPYPMHTRDDLISQVISIRKKYPTYKGFGKVSMNELWRPGDTSAMHFTATNMTTSYFENKGNGKFEIRSLPMEAQFAPVYGMLADDINDDGATDLVLSGNDYAMEPGSGRHDAFAGLCLLGNGKGSFTPVSLEQSGFYVKGDAKALAKIGSTANAQLYIATQNQDSLLIFSKSSKTTQQRTMIIEAMDQSAEVVYANGTRRKLEFYYGSTFLSQSTRKMSWPENATSVIITDFSGRKRTYK